MKPSTLLCCLLLLVSWITHAVGLHAQDTLHIRLAVAGQNSPFTALDPLIREYRGWWSGDSLLFLPAKGKHPDSLRATVIRHLWDASYHLAAFDDWITSDSAVQGLLYTGPAFQWIRIHPGKGLDKKKLHAAGVRLVAFEDKPLRYDAFREMQESLLRHAENNGHPFARVWLDSIDITGEGRVSGVLQYESGPFIRFGGVELLGDLKLPGSVLAQYLGIRPGSPYNQERLLETGNRLRNVLFAEPMGNPLVRFDGNRADIQVPMKKKQAGRFDFIIGMLPQPNNPDGRLLLTGTLSAVFLNALQLGERLAIEFERLRPETQKLDVQVQLPYVLGTPFGVEARLNIFRSDTSWVDAQGKLGIQYSFTPGNTLGFFWENRTLSLQAIDTAAIIRNKRLPPQLDLQQNGFGLELQQQALDYRFNPRKGWMFTMSGAAGFNQVVRNSRIENLKDPNNPEFSYSSLYDNLTERTVRFRARAVAEYYLPLFERSTLKTSIRAAGIFANTPVYNNEQYRLGGNRLLRGFNEETLFATRYAVGTAEWRLLTGTNGYFAVFADYGYLANLTDRLRIFQRPLGLGAGMVFETQAGLFGISGAIGRTDTGQPLDPRAVKIHLGYVNQF
jgi:outer membrane protein assembly factor BamA